MREIKRRIENVSSTKQLIRAMDTIATSKLLKARSQLEGVRPIYHSLKRQVEDIGKQEESLSHIYYQEREIKHSLYLVLTSDRGYVGSYNQNVKALAFKHMTEGNKNEKILSVGSKGYKFFQKKNMNIIRKITDITDSHMYYGTESLADYINELYLTGEVDEVFVVYTHFINVLQSEPQVEKLLPIASNYNELEYESDRKYEPSIDTVLDHIIPLYLHMNLFRAFSESHTSEQASRMVNMDAAGNNAEELIKDLTLNYNRQRQAAITQELSEIVGGTNFE